MYLKKPRKKNIFWLTLIWIFINKNWCFLLIHDWVIWVFHGLRLQLIGLPTMQQFTYLRMKLAWPERPSFAKLEKNKEHDINDEGIFVYNIPPWILQDFLKFELQTTYQKQTSRLKIDTLGGPKFNLLRAYRHLVSLELVWIYCLTTISGKPQLHPQRLACWTWKWLVSFRWFFLLPGVPYSQGPMP